MPRRDRASLSAAEYVDECRVIPGWMHRSDALVLSCIATTQTARGVAGDVLEVGAYHGRSAILLGYFLQEGERLHVCDLFEHQPAVDDARQGVRHYERLTRARFEETYAAYHPGKPATVHAVPSTELVPRGLVRPPFRIVHVDGSHEPEVVTRDVATARALLVDGGVAVFEDDHGVHVPRVPPALCVAFDRGTFAPLAVTAGKTYAVAGRDVCGLAAALEAWARTSGEVRPARSRLGTREVLALYPLPERAGTWRGLDRKLASARG